MSSSVISRRQFVKYGVTGAIGFGVATVIEVPALSNTIQSSNKTIQQQNTQISQLQDQAQQATQLQNQILVQDTIQTPSMSELAQIEALAKTIIPTFSNGPGAKDVAYFVDNQLIGPYGNSVGINPPKITFKTPYATPAYPYALPVREFWRTSLNDLEDYSKSAYSGNFEDLASNTQNQILTDLKNNKPTNFGSIIPQDFYNQLVFLVQASTIQ
jgi:hypothetical protein